MVDTIGVTGDREDFPCPHCGNVFHWSAYKGEEKTVSSLFTNRPHVWCPVCHRCCGCMPNIQKVVET